MLRQIIAPWRVIVNWGRKYYRDRRPAARPAAAFERIKPVGRIADAEPVATAEQLRLWHWLSEYYTCWGMVLRAALPASLKSDGFRRTRRSAAATCSRGKRSFRCIRTSAMRNGCTSRWIPCRAKSQYKALLEYLEKTGNPDFGAPIEIPRKRLSAPTAILKALAEKDLSGSPIPKSGIGRARRAGQTAELSAAQTAAYERIKTCFSEKEVVLLQGNRQRQDRNLHPADGRSAGSRAQRCTCCPKSR